MAVAMTLERLERLDPHGLARPDVAPLLLDHDEAVRRRHRGENARALGTGGAHLPVVASPGQDAALELAPADLLAERLRGRGVERLPEEVAPTRELPQGGADEEVEGEHGGHGIAGQAEEV